MHLSHLFQRSVHMYGERPALVSGTGEPLTYDALARRVRALAHWLRHDLGLQAGDRVTLAMKNCPEYAEIMLAAWHAELCAVPINSKLHPKEVDYVLRDSGSRLCLSSGGLLDDLRPVAAGIAGLHLVDAASSDYSEAATGPELELAPAPSCGDPLAWLFYTSGTTGRPKGVMLSHDNLVAMALNFYADLQPVAEDDALAHVAPMSHGGGLYAIPYWIHGAMQIVPESGGFDESELFSLLEYYRKVSFFAAPTIVQRMVRHASSHPVQWPGLRTVFVGGAPFYVEDIKAAVNRLGPCIAQLYGQGESPMTITAMTAQRIAAAVAADDDSFLASVGHAQTSMEITIADEKGQPFAAGAVGEVLVRGAVVMKGYWNNPAATAQTVADGALHTGDVGLLSERGLLYLKDRSKDVIISGGTNIYPREVEEVLLRHAGVGEVSVIGVPDEEWGESVAAFVVRAAGTEVSTAELDALCVESIARFKRPKHYCFLSELPKNGTGKVLKSELRNRLKTG
jgi:acyl-CoA synthetase (AMP-forming)/AMP-acid ligase II